MSIDVPEFEPHPLLRSGHLQTIGGRYLPGLPARLAARSQEIPLEDGDRLLVHDSVPEGWSPGGPAVVLVHGLGGCAKSPYVIRVGAKLVRMGVRVVRMNLRGAGAGFGLARQTYHGGRTEDPRAVLAWLADRAEGSPIALVGFSLGAALTLKLAGEAAETPVPGLDCILAVNPPIDLAACCEYIRRPENRLYDWNFVRSLHSDVKRLHGRFPELGPVDFKPMRTLFDFDDFYTAPRHGFKDAADYYARSSAAPFVSRIRLPGLVIHAEDDPFIPAQPFRALTFPPTLALELIHSGGHLGYLSRNRWGDDHRWLDARLVAWLAERWGRTPILREVSRPRRAIVASR